MILALIVMRKLILLKIIVPLGSFFVRFIMLAYQLFTRNKQNKISNSNNYYAANKGKLTIVKGSVRLLDKNHLLLPKLDELCFQGLLQKIFSHLSAILIGTTILLLVAL